MAIVAAEALFKFRPEEPEGWIDRSIALHGIGWTADAQEKLRPAAEKFPDDWRIQYNMARHAGPR